MRKELRQKKRSTPKPPAKIADRTALAAPSEKPARIQTDASLGSAWCAKTARKAKKRRPSSSGR